MSPNVTPSRSGVAARLLMAIGALAIAYYVSGRLGLLLAIPPGYASPLFPASGIALAGVLLGGYRVLPGVWLGSFLLNMGTAVGLPAPTLVLAAIVGLGACAQAALGTFLIRRLVGYRNLLVQEFDVVKILILGGPLACMLNPIVAVATLSLLGFVNDAAVLLNAWTWWVGDSIGVLVFTPLILVWAVRPYRIWGRRQLFVTLPLAVLFATVTAMFVFISAREHTRIAAEFEAATNELGRELQKELDRTVAALGALEGFYASSARIEPFEFEIFATRLLSALPSARTLVWAEVVHRSERAAFEAQMRAAGNKEFTIHERPGTGVPQPEESEGVHVPVRFVAPRVGNERLVGFDVLSEDARRAALEAARDTGRVTATGRVDLLQTGEAGLWALMPVYQNGVLPQSIVARRRYVEGFAVAVFRIEDFMQPVVDVAAARGFTVRLFDDGTPGKAELLYQQGAVPADAPGLNREFRFNFAGRPLRLALDYPDQLLLARRTWETWFVLAGGLVLASLVGMLLLLAVGRAARVEALVDERTAELRRLNAELIEEVARRRRLEAEAEKRVGEMADSNAELERRAEVNRELLRSLRQSETELRRIASELSTSNRELEQFAYVASHDLKAPLRSVGSYVEMLERRHGEKLGRDGQEVLGFIQEGVRQMQALIDDLLQLSRVDARRLELGPVSMRHVVDRACRQLTADLKATQAQVESGTLPEVHADANMLVQLLQNLIANAIKFQTPGNRPQIRIDAEVDNDQWHFTVRDNGIGIDPQHLPHIFLVFKRLHPNDQFPGNGIGLAICKKVVSLHRGEIWAESVPGVGTTVHFTLPRRMEATGDSVAA